MEGNFVFDISPHCVHQDAKEIQCTSEVGDWCLCATMGSNLDSAHAMQSDTEAKT